MGTSEAVGSRGEIVGETMTTIPVPPNGKVRPIDKIRAAFSDKQWKLDVPEWGFSVYFRPLTMADMEAVQMGLVDDQTSFSERQVRLLVHKARDENGQLLFASGDIYTLMREARADVVQRVCNYMMTCGSMSSTEAKETLGNGSASESATTSS